MPQADVSVQGAEPAGGPGEPQRAEQARFRVGACASPARNPAPGGSASSRGFAPKSTFQSVIYKVRCDFKVGPNGVTAHMSVFLSLQALLCFVPLFLSFLFKIMSYFSRSLAYIPSLAQTADNPILLLGFPGRGESRPVLRHAPKSVLGGKPPWQGLSTQRGAARLWGRPTGCKTTLLPDTAPLHP